MKQANRHIMPIGIVTSHTELDYLNVTTSNNHLQ